MNHDASAWRVRKRCLCWLALASALPGFGRATPPAVTVAEDFSEPPLTRGWRIVGDTALFDWNAADGWLDVTWDSRQPNSFFLRSLGTVLTKDDDFSLAFDLRLRDVAIGVQTNRPYTFELALGLIHLASATNTNFFRGTRAGTRNIVEFDYFPPFLSYGGTVALTAVSSDSDFAYSHNFPLELPLDELLRATMTYTASNRTLRTVMTRAAQPFEPLEDLVLSEPFTDFRVDAFAVSSFSDERADGSILAHGVVDNVTFTVPAALSNLAGALANDRWRASFDSRRNWLYTLERTVNFSSWTPASEATPGTGGTVVLEDAEPPVGAGFYRVRAERP